MPTTNHFLPIPVHRVVAAITDTEDGRTIADLLAAAATLDETQADFLKVVAGLYAWDGADLSRLLAESAAAPNLRVAIYDGAAGPADVAVAGATLAEDVATFLKGMVALYAMGAADLDRLLAQGSDSDNVANVATGLLRAAAYNYGYDGAAWDRILAVAGAMVVTGPYEDEDAWVFGTSRVFPMGAVADDAAVDSLAEDQVGIPRMTLTRVLNTVASDPTTITQRQAIIAAADDLDETLARYATTLAALYGFDGTTLRRVLQTDQDTGGGTDHALDVALMVPAAGGGTQLGLLDDAAFTVATSAVLPIAGMRLDAGDDVDDADVGVLRMTAHRQLLSVLSDPTTPTQQAVVLAAGADGIDNANDVLETAATGYDFNNLTWDRHRNNYDLTLLASGADTANGRTGAAVTNYNWRGGIINLNITAVNGTGSFTALAIQGQGPDGNWATLYSFGGMAIVATGNYWFAVYPGAASAGSFTSQPMQGVLPRTFRVVTTTATDAVGNNLTYEVELNGVL